MTRSRLIVIAAIAGMLLAGCASGQTVSKAPESSTPTSTTSGTTAESSPDATEPSDTTSATQDPEEYNNMPLGRSIVGTGTDDKDRPYSVTITVTSVRTSKRALQEYTEPPKHTYLGVKVTYTCTQGLCDYNFYDWKLRGADGTEYDNEFGNGFEPELNSGKLHKGGKATGWITYDVKRGTYTVEYSDMENVASWVVRFA